MLRRLLPWLFEAVLDLYVRWMASGARQYVVPSRTVSSLLKEHQLAAVQLLKVDVEGAEVEVRGFYRSNSEHCTTCSCLLGLKSLIVGEVGVVQCLQRYNTWCCCYGMHV